MLKVVLKSAGLFTQAGERGLTILALRMKNYDSKDIFAYMLEIIFTGLPKILGL